MLLLKNLRKFNQLIVAYITGVNQIWRYLQYLIINSVMKYMIWLINTLYGRVLTGGSPMTQEEIKRETIRLYDQLPQDEEGRKARLDIRDKIIELNYAFFGYVATHTFINNTSVTYEDKLQSALSHFLECWWWYRWAERYRTDLSFAVFFKLRIAEMIERELNEVKYSIRRSLCMEAGEQLGKHWGQVKYDDLANVNLPPAKMNSLKAIFGTLYWADLETHEMFIAADPYVPSIFDEYTEKYDDIQSLIIHTLIEEEAPLKESDLRKMSDMYDIPLEKLQAEYPKALAVLYEKLHRNLDLAME